MMQNKNPSIGAPDQQITDWIVTSLRWLTLLGIAIALAVQEPLTLPMILALMLAAFWNATFTILVALNRRLAAHRPISILGDMIIAYTFFYLGGLTEGQLVWVGILPLMSASLYYQNNGVLIATFVNLIVQGGLSLLAIDERSTLVFIVTLLPFYLGLGLAFSFLSKRMQRILNSSTQNQAAHVSEFNQGQLNRQKRILNLVSKLSASLNYQRVLDTSLDAAAEALDTPDQSVDLLTSAFMLYSKNHSKSTELHIGASHRFTPADLRLTLPGTSGLIGRAIDRGVPALSQNITNDAELKRFVSLHACKSAYCFPLRSGLNAYGVLLFAHPDPDYFTAEHVEILDFVGNQVVIAIENAELYRDLEQEKERILEIEEDARKKMARDLHDGPTQSVSAIAMRVNFARRLIERDPKATADELYKIEELARRTTKEIRHMLFTLRPLVLESQGLIAALESMAVKLRETYNQNVIVQAEENIAAELEPIKQAVVFYIVEEAVHNARKHAKAPNIWVRLKPFKSDIALLEIQDDGLGFNVSEISSAYDQRGSLGLVNMRERADLVNGMLRIESAPGRGTRIQVIIPLTEEAAERLRRSP